MDYIMTFLSLVFIILVMWIVFVEIILRMLRHYVNFPIPAFIGSFIDNPVRRRIQSPSKIVNWIGIEEGMAVLEIGPGPGTFTIEAAKHAGIGGYIIAVDIQFNMILKLRDRLKEKGVTNVEPIVGSALYLPLRDKIFDVVYMIAVFGELPNKEKALSEIRNVLKDEGVFAIGEFLPDPDCPRRKTVISWCEKAGFELVNRYGHFLHYLLTFKKQMLD